VTVTIFTSASEAKTEGYTFSILQFEASSLFNSEIDLNPSDDTHHSFTITIYFILFSSSHFLLCSSIIDKVKCRSFASGLKLQFYSMSF
jgi:hypothetical protein